jgi:MoaA/NifB/PqqE/SkfB family radical SAM enzyme
MNSLLRKIEECEHSAINAWAEGRDKGVPDPWLAYVNLTNICNNDCGMCPQAESMREDRGKMSLELFEQVIERLPQSITKIYLIKQGEPFVHPQLEHVVRILREKRPAVHIALHTNALLATRERVAQVLPYIDSMGISISALDAQGYQITAGSRHFDRALERIGGICAELRMMPEEGRPHVFLDFVRQDANRQWGDEEVVEFFSRRFPELVSVDIHWVFNWQGDVPEGNLEVYEKLPREQFPCCVLPWGSVTVCHDGKLSYCFEEARENRFLGDLSNSDFDEVWNGKEYRKFRAAFAARDFDALDSEGFHCSRCAFLWSMHTQSPRNLSGGYTAAHQLREPSFGQVLDMEQTRQLELAADYYLDGEVQKAFGVAAMVEAVGATEPLKAAARRIQTLCRAVFGNYRNLAVWHEHLEREQVPLSERRSRYIPIVPIDG